MTCTFYGAVSIVQIVFATPKPGETWLEYNLSEKGLKAEVLSVPQAAVGLGIDLVLLIMPIVAVQGLKLPTKRKMGIIVIFTIGIL